MDNNQANDIRQEYNALCAEIEQHNKLYYQMGAPKITDAEYDALFRKAQQLEQQYPWLKTNTSPTETVGNDQTEGFAKIAHAVPMLSIEDVFEQRTNLPYDELHQWMVRLDIQQLDQKFIVVEPKIDGCAVTLMYKHGVLEYAATRGSGAIGDVITDNIKTIADIPHQLPGESEDWPEIIEVRGEVYMEQEAFQQLNAERAAAGLSTFANPRNTTAGTLKLLDSTEVAKRPLRFIAHGTGQLSNPDAVTNVLDFYDLMDTMGIPSLRYKSTCGRLREVVNTVEALRKEVIPSLPYNTDGAVVKLWNYNDRAALGNTSRCPRWACAFKFLPERKKTQLLGITLQVGRTGTVTPVAELEPIQLAGTTVSRATLHNQDQITQKDIRIGDTVIVEKAGEIIPSVVGVVLQKRTKDSVPYDILQQTNGACPVCGGKLERVEGKSAIVCTNDNCPAQLAAKIQHMCRREALDIEDIGDSVADALVASGKVACVWDLFQLTESTLAELQIVSEETGTSSRLGNTVAAKIVAAASKAKTLPLDRWLIACGIPGVGAVTARKLTASIKDWNAFIEGAFVIAIRNCVIALDASKGTKEEATKRRYLQEAMQHAAPFTETGHLTLEESRSGLKLTAPIKGKAATDILNWICSPAGDNVQQVWKDLWGGFNPVSDNYTANMLTPATGPLSGQVVVITGTLTKERSYFVRLVESAGGKVGSSVTKKTTLVLVGDEAGSKLTKATELGITIVDEPTFMSMVEV